MESFPQFQVRTFCVFVVILTVFTFCSRLAYGECQSEFNEACPSVVVTADDAPQWFDTFVMARAGYLNDQRVEWSGQEATFFAEGIVAAIVGHQCNGWEFELDSEFYLNQPYDRNILTDSVERESYKANFDFEPFSIQTLNVSGRYDRLKILVGKMVTPFGRFYEPLLTNQRIDAPFIRTESILWRETGLLLQYERGLFELDASVVNGSEDRDTNSSKALVARAGLQGQCWAVGASVKWQDGIGSESQKQYKNHVGMDAMIRRGPWTVSSEVIYDQYGFRNPTFDPDEIFWGRSIYYRDQNLAFEEPITGFGYYVSLMYEGDLWTSILNYGENYPSQIGDPRHDVTTRRGYWKGIYSITEHVDAYGMVLVENNVEDAQAGRERKGFGVLVGFSYVL